MRKNPPSLQSRNHYFLTRATCVLLNTAQDKRKRVLGMTAELCVDQTYGLSTCDAEFWNFCFPVSLFPINGQERCPLVWGTVTQKKSFLLNLPHYKMKAQKAHNWPAKRKQSGQVLFFNKYKDKFSLHFFNLVIILKNNPARWELGREVRDPSPGPGWSWPEGTQGGHLVLSTKLLALPCSHWAVLLISTCTAFLDWGNPWENPLLSQRPHIRVICSSDGSC